MRRQQCNSLLANSRTSHVIEVHTVMLFATVTAFSQWCTIQCCETITKWLLYCGITIHFPQKYYHDANFKCCKLFLTISHTGHISIRWSVSELLPIACTSTKWSASYCRWRTRYRNSRRSGKRLCIGSNTWPQVWQRPAIID